MPLGERAEMGEIPNFFQSLLGASGVPAIFFGQFRI